MESVMKKTAATSLLASCAVSLALFSSCASQEQNTLTPEEIADGWFCFLMERHWMVGKITTGLH